MAINKELMRRTLSGIPLALITLVAFYFGGVLLAGFVGVVMSLAYWEWLGLTAVPRRSLMFFAGLLLIAIFIGLAVGGFKDFGRVNLSLIALGFAFIGAFIARYIAKGTQSGALWTGFGLLYLGFAGATILYLRFGEVTVDLEHLFQIMVTVVATDIGAYFVGRALGGPKLAPKISPGKTISGALGGIGIAVVTVLLLTLLFFSDWGLNWTNILFIVVISVVSQMGDLFISWLKRRVGLKDTGHILPGHGGVLDRIDGLIAVFFAFYILQLFLK